MSNVVWRNISAAFAAANILGVIRGFMLEDYDSVIAFSVFGVVLIYCTIQFTKRIQDSNSNERHSAP